MALNRLEAHHLIAIQYLSQPNRGGKTMDEIGELAGGYSKQSVYNWLKEPLFDRELKKQIVRNSMKRLPEVVESMADAAIKDKNAAAAKLIFQVNDMLTDKVSVETTTKQELPDLDDMRRMLEEDSAEKA